jgi:NDP-sugar pyrophosphorylase family protein
MVLPKPLMPIGDMPILEIVLRQLRSHGFADIVIAVGHLGALIRTYFGDGSRLGLRVDYALEEEPLGTAGPIGGIAGLDDTFLVMNGDILTDLDFGAFVAAHRRHGALLTVATYRRTVKIDYGVLETEGDSVTRYIEKPTLDYVVSMGVYAMEPQVRDRIPPGRYLDVPDLVRMLLSAGDRVGAYGFDGRWLDIGRPDDFLEAQSRFEEHRDLFLK